MPRVALAVPWQNLWPRRAQLQFPRVAIAELLLNFLGSRRGSIGKAGASKAHGQGFDPHRGPHRRDHPPGVSFLWQVRIELTTLGLWGLRATSCATATVGHGQEW